MKLNTNKKLSEEELDESVQRILDRLIFIRNLEDREIEQENTLLDLTKNKDDVYTIYEVSSSCR